MADREKVIKALEACSDYDVTCEECPYCPKENDTGICEDRLLRDAMELLLRDAMELMKREEDDGK